MKRRRDFKLSSGNVIIAFGCAVTITLGGAMYIADRNSAKAEYDLYELGVEFYNNEDYDSAYSTFDCITSINKDMSEEKLNKKFPDIISYKNKAYDETICDNIADYINNEENYQAAIEEAYKLTDKSRKDEIVSDILYLVGEEAIYENESLEGGI